MPDIKTTSQAQIRRALVRVVEYANPELILPPLLREYFLEVGYSEMYPNFKGVRIGTVHPFALLLFQEVLGQRLDLNVFPSVTVSDTSDTEVFDTLGRDIEDVVFNEEQITQMLGYVDSGQLLLADSGKTALLDAVAGGNVVTGRKVGYRVNHNVDLNIWSDNKDITSLVYDLVKHFIISNIAKLHEEGLDAQSAIVGRRSGDINVEFGSLLYGANITVPITIHTSSTLFDVEYGVIAEVDTVTEPTYYEPE